MRKINKPDCPNPSALSSDYKHPENKDALINASYSKCMYCESKITHVYFGDIEHIKPKTKYPNLKFEWSNLGFVCAKCNNAKSDQYNETTPYINPYEEDPNNFVFAFGALLKNKQGSERGELTIADITLNRPDLIEKRQTNLELINKTVDACMRTKNETLKNTALEAIKKECGEDKEYSLFVKTLLQLHQII